MANKTTNTYEFFKDKAVTIAHADYIYEKIETFGLEFDIEIEAKAKEMAVLKYRKEFLQKLENNFYIFNI